MSAPTRRQRRDEQSQQAGSPQRAGNENRMDPRFRPVSPEERSRVRPSDYKAISALKNPLPPVYSTFDRRGRKPERQRRGIGVHRSDTDANIRWSPRKTTESSFSTSEAASGSLASPAAGSTQYRVPRAALAPWGNVVSAPARALSSSGSSGHGAETPHMDETGLPGIQPIVTTVNGVQVKAYNAAEVWLTAVHPIVTIVNGEEITLPHTYSLEVTSVPSGNARTGATLGYLQRLQNLTMTQHQSTSSDGSDGVLMELQELVKKDGRARISLATAASTQTQSSGSDVPVLATTASDTETRPVELQSSEERQGEDARYQRMLSRLRLPFEKYGITGLIRPPPGFGDPAILAIKPMVEDNKPLDGSTLPGRHPVRSLDNGQAPEHRTTGPVDNKHTETNHSETPVIVHPEDIEAKDDFSDDIETIRSVRNSGYASRSTDRNTTGSSEANQDDSRAAVLHTSTQLSGNTRGNSTLNPAAPEFTGPHVYGPRRLARPPLTNVFPHAMENASSIPGTSTAYQAPVPPEPAGYTTDGPVHGGLAPANPHVWQTMPRLAPANGTFPAHTPAPHPMAANLVSVPTPAMRPPPGFEAFAQPVLLNRYGTFPPATVGYIGNAFPPAGPAQYRAPLATTTNLPAHPANAPANVPANPNGYHTNNTNTGAGTGVPVTPLVPTLPYFPVTTKPPVPDTWSQQEFERYHEYKKATDENFRTSCKIRQARRALRQAQELALGPRAAQEARSAIAPPPGFPAAPANPAPIAPIAPPPRLPAAPVSTAPATPAPVNTAPVNAAPVNAAPVNTASANAAPVNATPVPQAPVNVASVNDAPAPISPAPLPLNTIPFAKVPGLYQGEAGESSSIGAAREARAAAAASANTTTTATAPALHDHHNPSAGPSLSTNNTTAAATAPALTDRKGKGKAPPTPATPAATPLPVSTSSNTHSNNNINNDRVHNATTVASIHGHRHRQPNTTNHNPNGKAPQQYDSSRMTAPQAPTAAVRRAVTEAMSARAAAAREAQLEEEAEVARETRARGERVRAELKRKVGEVGVRGGKGEKGGKGKGKAKGRGGGD